MPYIPEDEYHEMERKLGVIEHWMLNDCGRRVRWWELTVMWCIGAAITYSIQPTATATAIMYGEAMAFFMVWLNWGVRR